MGNEDLRKKITRRNRLLREKNKLIQKKDEEIQRLWQKLRRSETSHSWCSKPELPKSDLSTKFLALGFESDQSDESYSEANSSDDNNLEETEICEQTTIEMFKEDLKQIESENDDSFICSRCENDKNTRTRVLFLPCGHGSCKSCATYDIKLCHICSSEIEAVTPQFLVS